MMTMDHERQVSLGDNDKIFIDTHQIQQIEDQLLRRMRGQLQSLETAKMQAEEQSAEMGAQNQNLMAENAQLRQRLQQVETELDSVVTEKDYVIRQL